MLKTHKTVEDTNINANRLLKLEKKNAATKENCILRKMGLTFQNFIFNILCKIAFWNNWNKQKWLMKAWLYGASCRVKRQLVWCNSLEKSYISLVRKFLIAWNRTSLHSPSQASWLSMLFHFHKMPIRMGHPSKGDRMLFQAST